MPLFRKNSSNSSRGSSVMASSPGGALPAVLKSKHHKSRALLPQAGESLSIEVEGKNLRRRFPLQDAILPEVNVTEEQRQQLKMRCQAEMKRMLAKLPRVWQDEEALFDGGRHAWTKHYDKPNLVLHRHKGERTRRHFVARGHIASVTLKDIEYALYRDTTTQERAVMTDLFRELFLDAAVLRVFEKQTEEDPFHFFGLKWLVYTSPVDKLVSPRDYAYVEYSHRVTTPQGEVVLARVVLPVDTLTVSVLNAHAYDVVRGSMACSSLYRYDAMAREVEVVSEGLLDPSGIVPSWLSKTFLTHLAPTLVNLEQCADVKHLMAHGHVLSTRAFQARVADARATQPAMCVACLEPLPSGRSVSLRRRPQVHCRACGEMVCSRCVMTLTLCLPGHEKRNADHPSAVIDEKFCFKCICLIQEQRNAQGTTRMRTLASIMGDVTPRGEDWGSLSSSAAWEPLRPRLTRERHDMEAALHAIDATIASLMESNWGDRGTEPRMSLHRVRDSSPGSPAMLGGDDTPMMRTMASKSSPSRKESQPRPAGNPWDHGVAARFVQSARSASPVYTQGHLNIAPLDKYVEDEGASVYFSRTWSTPLLATLAGQEEAQQQQQRQRDKEETTRTERAQMTAALLEYNRSRRWRPVSTSSSYQVHQDMFTPRTGAGHREDDSEYKFGTGAHELRWH